MQGASAWNGSGSSGDPYLIASPADWNTLASNVANGNFSQSCNDAGVKYAKSGVGCAVFTILACRFCRSYGGWDLEYDGVSCRARLVVKQT